MRHIDADAFAKSIELSIKSWSGDCNSNAPTMVLAYKDVLHRLQNAPTANEWISVQDRLPDRSGTYIVIGKSGTPHTAHFYAEAPKFSNQYVRFWMPFPAAPVEVEECEN